MENSQENKKEENSRRSGLSLYFDWAGAIIITIIILGFLVAIGFYFRESKVSSKIVSVHKTTKVEYAQRITKDPNRKLDSLSFALQKINISLTDSLQNLRSEYETSKITSQETETKLKLIASLIAIIFAISGFFGFKSLNEIREYTIKEAKLDASSIASEVAKQIAEDISKDQIKKGFKSLRVKFMMLEKSVQNGFEDLSGENIAISQRLDELRRLIDECCGSDAEVLEDADTLEIVDPKVVVDESMNDANDIDNEDKPLII